METADYIKAGRVAGEVREMVRGRDWTGSTVYDLCEWVEAEIKSRGARCAFPVNASINEVAAHYTAEPGDELTIQPDDVVKVDLGAHVNGHIADTAVTISHSGRHDALITAAENALAGAMRLCRAGAKSTQIGKAIEQVIRGAGFKPIANLSGHSLDRYTIHAGKTIPNLRSFMGFKLSEESAYACEPFCTYGDGGGFVRNGSVKNIFALNNRKPTRDKRADAMATYIWEEFNLLPFALRWLTAEFGDEAAGLLDKLVRKKTVKAYPVLVESHGKIVAQAEHTFIPGPGGPTITTEWRRG